MQQPKGNNSNSPMQVSAPSDNSIVTRRKAQYLSQQGASKITLPSEGYVMRSELREIIREEVQLAVRECMSEINISLTSTLSKINEQISTFQESMNFLNGEIEKLKSDIKTCQSDITSFKEEKQACTSMGTLSNKIMEIDQIMRAANIELQCVPEHRGENLASLTKQLGRTVGCLINDTDIYYCSRTAKMNPNSTRPRSILVKLSSPQLRDSLLASVQKYNKAHPQNKLNTSDLGIAAKSCTQIYVVENLSPENKSLHAAARLRAKELNYKFVWVRAGRIFMRNSGSEDNNVDDCMFNNTLSKVHFQEREVFTVLKELDKTKGAGGDGVPAIFLSNCAKSLSYPICILFNKSLQECTFPNIWKQANIVPVYKKGLKNLIINYRPISILKTLSKLMELLVYRRIYPIIKQGISENQHGFLKSRSTTSNLAIFSDDVFNGMEHSGQVDVIYTDFEKAFDRVDHAILLYKLNKLGIHGDLLRWIQSYLKNRSQAVTIGGHRSNYIEIPSGVPQGSHLGPLFYCAYLYDIDKCLQNAKHLMYADDTKIYMTISNLNDCKLLQMDLDSLYDYYIKNRISVNIKKCHCISFTKKKDPIVYPYKFENVAVERVDEIRDLGVIFDSKMYQQNKFLDVKVLVLDTQFKGSYHS
ncbi:uncharacterized protein LOC123722157 [Papilio machaon]|uniref:uncharacterized protein LOC123722157 n=1 Tax=Papilio machaon TaxID=76193 RepID=UPI001E665604|nr:uncharacterized protein LOC123722157 [Papilio machaon]